MAIYRSWCGTRKYKIAVENHLTGVVINAPTTRLPCLEGYFRVTGMASVPALVYFPVILPNKPAKSEKKNFISQMFLYRPSKNHLQLADEFVATTFVGPR